MSDSSQGPGWWQASDQKWYPPESAAPIAQPQQPTAAQPPQFGQQQPSYGSAPPPQPQKSSNSLKILLWIFGGLFLLGLLSIGGCVLLIDSASDSLEDVSDAFEESFEESFGESIQTGSQSDPVGKGDEVNLGNGWFVTVSGADLNANEAVAAADEFNSPPEVGLRYVVVEVQARYDGGSDQEPESPSEAFSISLFGSANVERSDFDTFATAPSPALDRSSELTPGGTATGNLVFEVGENETDLVVRVESWGFNESTGWIGLG